MNASPAPTPPAPKVERVGIVGAGLVGLGWTAVFAGAGKQVMVHDGDSGALERGPGRLAAMLADMEAHGLIPSASTVLARVGWTADLGEAVANAEYVQESVFETIAAKHDAAMRIGAVLRPEAMVGSSSSGIPASAFTEDVPNRARFLIVHPVNPPHLIPLVELVAAPWTDPALVPATHALMREVGQAPIVVNREIEGFVLNRLQGALLNEAFALYEEGVASLADIDLTVSHGLGRRWSLLGPFATIDLNAPSGIADYAARLGPLYHGIARDRAAPRPWSDALIARIEAEQRERLALADLGAAMAARDLGMIRALAHGRTPATAGDDTAPPAGG